MVSLLCWSTHRWCRYPSVISESPGTSPCCHLWIVRYLPMLSSETHSCKNHVSHRLQWVQMLLYVCTTSSSQCGMHAYVLATKTYAYVRPVSYTHPTWTCKASQLHRSIVPLKSESRSIYNGLSRMFWSITKLLQALQNFFLAEYISPSLFLSFPPCTNTLLFGDFAMKVPPPLPRKSRLCRVGMCLIDLSSHYIWPLESHVLFWD